VAALTVYGLGDLLKSQGDVEGAKDAFQKAIDSGHTNVAPRAARDVLAIAGYAKYLNNRVGHSIGTEVHGNGANMDNFESRDEREVLPNTCFSIEPGIYLSEFGLRSEVNVLVRPGSAEVTGRIQEEMILI
ncbi:MAG: M24 family metallopeptidase, partial [Candidatus Sulfotelmatobacter sp.]